MVLKLKTPLSSIVQDKFNKLSYLPLPNASLKLFGFGAHSESNPAPSRRHREVGVVVGDFDKCNQQYQLRLSSGLHLCTIAVPGSRGDGCEGDGGTPYHQESQREVGHSSRSAEFLALLGVEDVTRTVATVESLITQLGSKCRYVISVEIKADVARFSRSKVYAFANYG